MSGTHLDAAEKAEIVALHTAGVSRRAIARTMNRDKQTVGHFLAVVTPRPTPEIIQELMDASYTRGYQDGVQSAPAKGD